MSYKVEITEKKDPVVQLEPSKLSIKDLFNDLLNETKGLSIRLLNTISMEKMNYFNSVTKTVINLFKKFYT